MDGASVVLGLPGLIQTCVHGYRLVCVMIDMDKTAAVMRIRYRIEESRLVLWARFWGLMDPDHYSKVKPGTQNFDDLLEIPGIKALINDILDQVLTSLKEARKLSQKYTGVEPQSLTTKGTPTKPNPWPKQSTTSKIKWAIKDKASFESVLASLTSLNDGLEQLLPRGQRVALEQALVGEVLAEERIKPGDGESKKLAAAFEGKDTDFQDGPPNEAREDQQGRMISVRSIQDRHHASYKKSFDPGADGFGDVKEDDQVEAKADESLPAASMQLPMEWFAKTTAKGDGFSLESMRLPPDFVPGVPYNKKSCGGEGLTDEKTNIMAEFVEETVFVEWRNYDDSALDAQLQMALDARREQVSRLFHREAEDDNHSVMQCLGFVLPDQSKMGLVFRAPADEVGPPVSLHEMMRNDFESASAIVPDLEERLALAKKLSTALYKLQCSGWLHRQISSHNTARYDDQIYDSAASEGLRIWRKNEWKTKELPYVHPSRPAAKTRFKRSFDVYSLGIVLAEIAFWEPIDVLGVGGLLEMFSRVDQNSKTPELQQFSKTVISTCKHELAGEIGGRYQAAVVWALEGVKNWHAEQAAAGINASEEELNKEIGLEKAFFWNVLNQLNESPFGAQV